MDIRELIPTKPRERATLFITLGILVCTAIWILYFAIAHMDFKRAKIPHSAGITAAQAVTAKLNEDHDFADVGVGVLTERPLKFVVKGAVYSQADLDKLPGLLKEIKPDAEYQLEVELLSR